MATPEIYPVSALSLRERSRGERGIAVIMMAILIALFLAFGGLVLDGGRIYFEKRRMQAAADAAAYGGALELKRGLRPNLNLEDEIITAGRDDARINGVEHGVNTIDVAINHPPTTGPNAGSTGHVEAIITQTVPTFLMRVLNINTATVRARGVAGLEANGDACVIALDPDDRGALRVAGTALLDAQCGVLSNSFDSCGMEVSGNAEVHGTWIGVAGQHCGGGLYDPPAQNGALQIIDPLARMTAPDYASVTPVFNNVSINNGTANLVPGYYSGGIKISGSSSVVNFAAGLYILDSGMDISGGTITGDEVTFYNVGNKYISISGATSVELSAPTSGPQQGMLFWGDAASPDGNPGHLIRGTSQTSFTGAIYFPTQHVDWAGTNDTIGEWTMLVANTIDITGNGTVTQTLNPPPPGALPQVTTATLVE
jgi:hypothetical protein